MTVQRDVVVTILKETASLTRPGFGTALIGGYHTHFANRVKEYAELSELVTDGFATTHPIYVAASVLKSQNPCPRKFKVGRMSAPTRVVTITPTSANSTLFTVIINGVAFPYTSDTASSASEIVSGLASLINGGDEPVTASGTTTLIITADVPGVHFSVAVSDGANLKLLAIEDTTVDRGIAADIAAIIAEDPNWFGFAPADAFGAAEIALIAAAIETQARMAMAVSQDTGCIDANETGDIMSTLQDSSREQTAVVYHSTPEQYVNVASMSRNFAISPAEQQSALNNKVLIGPTAIVLTEGEMSAIDAKNGNHFTSVGGNGRFRYGRMPSGEWWDVVRGTFWLQSEAELEVFGALAAGEIVTYEQSSADMVAATLQAVLNRAVRTRLLASDPPPLATAPDVLDASQVTAQNRLDRVLPNVVGSGRYAGAINRASITIRLGA